MKEVTGEDGKPDLLISLDREKINTVGQEAIAKFSRRQIVVDGKQTRSILVQANTRLVNEKLELVQCEPNPGLVK